MNVFYYVQVLIYAQRLTHCKHVFHHCVDATSLDIFTQRVSSLRVLTVHDYEVYKISPFIGVTNLSSCRIFPLDWMLSS